MVVVLVCRLSKVVVLVVVCCGCQSLLCCQKVVVCRTDKDGKILIVNYSDYHENIKKD